MVAMDDKLSHQCYETQKDNTEFLCYQIKNIGPLRFCVQWPQKNEGDGYTIESKKITVKFCPFCGYNSM